MTSPALERILLANRALTHVVVHLESVHGSAAAASQPDLDQLAAEIRDALEKAATQMESVLSELTGEIWGELPRHVQDACLVAMPGLDLEPTEDD